jgi:hypothetical protein
MTRSLENPDSMAFLFDSFGLLELGDLLSAQEVGELRRLVLKNHPVPGKAKADYTFGGGNDRDEGPGFFAWGPEFRSDLEKPCLRAALDFLFGSDG